MSDKKNRIIIVLLILNLAVTSGMGVYLAVSAHKEKSNMYSQEEYDKVDTYTLYIGTNDKDTCMQEIPLDEAREIVNEICAKYVDGYTVSEAKGGWVDEKGKMTEEDTLIYTFYDTKEEQINNIMDEVLVALNQNSILVKYDSAYSRYYSVKEE